MSATITIHRSDLHRPDLHRPEIHRRADGRPVRHQHAPRADAGTVSITGESITSEATFRRRRAIVGTVLAVVVACTAVLAHDVLAGSGGVPASAAASQPAHVRSSITAQPGDTLWSIAEIHRGTTSVTRYVDKLVGLNGGPSIAAGQQVVLP